MNRVKAAIKGAVLEWARNSAGLDLETAARKVSQTTTAEKIAAWEAEVEMPTIPQLRKLAEAYKRPLSLFFLPKPPADFQPMHDFRLLRGSEATYTPLLLRELRSANERRELALDLLDDLGDRAPRFSLNAILSDDPEDVGVAIRKALNVTFTEQTSPNNRRASLTFWRRKIESKGVLVFQSERVDTSEMLGFSISNEVLPVLVVNRKNKRGRVFTALHEFTHLMLRKGGICDLRDGQHRHADQAVEVFCNAVAGAALVPASDLLTHAIVSAKGTGRHDWSVEELDAVANRFGVSPLVVMRRLLALDRTTAKAYAEKQRAYEAIYAQLDRQNRDALSDDGIPRNMPVETVARLGRSFIQLVLANYQNDRITLSDVSEYLGVRVRHIPKIEEQMAG